jgi:hypothetical protein
METHRDEMKSHQCSKAPCQRRNPHDAGATLYGIVIALTAGGAGSSLGSIPGIDGLPNTTRSIIARI